VYRYDNGVPNFWPDGYKTPDVFGHYTTGQAPSTPYLATDKTKVGGGRLFNYFNEKDFALILGWRANNRLKPDNTAGYFYEDKDNNMDTYIPNTDQPSLGDWFHTRARTPVFPDNRFEIFARTAQSRSQALGREKNAVDGFEPINLEDARLGFDGWHYSHSRQFRSNIAAERWFWKSVGVDFNLSGNSFIEKLDDR